MPLTYSSPNATEPSISIFLIISLFSIIKSALGPGNFPEIKWWSVLIDNFNSSLDEIKNNGFDDRFIRLWNYYLAYCESGFKAKRIGLNQIKIIHT